MKTWQAKTAEVERKWWVVDATGQTLGRLSTQIATLLRGKHKPQFTPHIDTGDFVIVVCGERASPVAVGFLTTLVTLVDISSVPFLVLYTLFYYKNKSCLPLNFSFPETYHSQANLI